MMRFIRAVPIPMAALALAFAALGNLMLKLPHGLELGEIVRYGCGIVSVILLILVILKLILDHPHARSELKTPVPLSVLPTVTMTLMLLCTYIKPFLGDATTYLWYVVVATQVIIMLGFITRFVRDFKLESVFASWFVVAVGIVVASVTAPAMNAIFVGQIAFYIGLSLYILTLPVVIYRLVKRPAMMEPFTLTTAIFTAPASLLLVGYLNSFAEQVDQTVVYALLVTAAVMYLYVSAKMISMLRVKFYPTYAAFTFPLVISATAFRQAHVFLTAQGFSFFAPVAMLSMIIAITIVVYVFVRYIMYFKYYLSFSR